MMPPDAPLIHPELARLLPPLTPVEYDLLREQVRKVGFLTSILVARIDGVLYVLDGHHRMAIAQELGRWPTMMEIPFVTTLAAAKEYIILLQSSRRNQGNRKQRYARGALYNLLHSRAFGGGSGGPSDGLPQAPPVTAHGEHSVMSAHSEHSHDEGGIGLAKKYGIGYATLRRDAEFAAAVDEVEAAHSGARERLLDRDTAISRASLIRARKEGGAWVRRIADLIGLANATPLASSGPQATSTQDQQGWRPDPPAFWGGLSPFLRANSGAASPGGASPAPAGGQTGSGTFAGQVPHPAPAGYGAPLTASTPPVDGTNMAALAHAVAAAKAATPWAAAPVPQPGPTTTATVATPSPVWTDDELKEVISNLNAANSGSTNARGRSTHLLEVARQRRPDLFMAH